MSQKVKSEKKKKMWGKLVSSSPDVVVSAAIPADETKLSSSSPSSSRKRKFPSLRRVFRRILSAILPCVSSSSELDESSTIETQTTSGDTHTDVSSDVSSSPAVSGSSDPEVDLQAATHEKEAIRDIDEEQSSPSSTEDTSSSAESSPSDLETSGGYTSTSAVGVSSSEESGKIDLLAELQAAAVLEDAAGDQPISDVDLDCILSVLASMAPQSNGLSQTEILELIQSSSQQKQIKIEQQISESITEDDVELADVAQTVLPTNIKHLGFPNLGNTCYMNSVLQCLLTVSPFRDDVLSQRKRWNERSTMLRALTDLHMTRLTGNDKKLKAKLLSTVKACIETRHPDFLGDHQQDAHEFLMVCLSYLKDKGELLQSSWPKYTCPVANMEFQLNRLRTCNSCGFQRSFREDYNYLSLVISPQGCLTDSLQQYFKTSSFDCSCSECAGTTSSEALELITLPRVLVLLVMRFDVTSSMCKLEDRLDVPEEFSLSSSAGHYISHIRDVSGSGWLECSDTSIRKSSWSKASRDIRKNGYMLFYVKR
ncbi:ubiquitin carboxyl-terminal hydrolase 37-like protein [Labeo rohita]|uniref:Ubiquitin carboxyl-terminal hydrolase 37-like protein n=1 Tax=Labeo rohita TaxID=84645 RepID=A0A498LGW1_LABRO|nr:ubiquitin carboxyl-terminal hydrolase 37-like protein [Labeo rohita]